MYKSLTPLFNTFPQRPGCYIVRISGCVLYVGQSKNIWKRWMKSGHNHREFIEMHFPEAKFEFVFCDVGELLETEKRLIKELKPILNGTGKWDIEYELGVRKPYRGWKSKGLLPHPKHAYYDDLADSVR